MLSVIIPAYNEGAMIEKTADTISAILQKAGLVYEIIFVNDGSKDDTWSQIKKKSETDERIRGVCFSRNFW